MFKTYAVVNLHLHSLKQTFKAQCNTYWIPRNAHRCAVSGLHIHVGLQHVSVCHGHPPGGLGHKGEIH